MTYKLIMCALPIAAIGGSLNAQSGKGASRPNLVIIMSDDHAFQTISAYNHPISQLARTPNIDRIAEQGELFTNAFVENSISAPARATMLTGMYSCHHGQTKLQYGLIDSTKVFFPELLQKAGYQTAVFGKWHLSAEPRGFDYFEILNDQGEYYNPQFRDSNSEGKYTRKSGYATEIITDDAIAWLERHKDSEKPFCLLIYHKAPHRNWMPRLKDITMYEDVKFPEPATLFDDYSTRGDQMKEQELTIDKDLGFPFDLKVPELLDEPTHKYIKDSYYIAMSSFTPEEKAVWDSTYYSLNKPFLDDMPSGKELVEWKYQRYVHDYVRTIHAVDEQVGRVLDYLQNNSLEKNTMVVYTSDQGFYLGEHGLYDKRFMYEESLRTPLLISWPGHIEPHTVCDNMVQNIDYAPTFLDVAKIEVPKDMDGISLLPLFGNAHKSRWRDSIYYEFFDYPSVGAVRRQDRKSVV